MKDILQRYVGQNIGINFKEVKEFDTVQLLKVTEEYFTVQVPKSQIMRSYPYAWVLSITEADGGLSSGSTFWMNKKSFPVCVEVFHLVVYSGGVGISF